MSAPALVGADPGPARKPALETRTLATRVAAVRSERGAVRATRAVAARALTLLQRRLATRVRDLYERENADPLAIVLGAQSLDEAIAGLDGLALAAEHDRELITKTLAAERRLAALSRTLTLRSRALARARAVALAAAAKSAPARSPADPAAPAARGRRITVTATGYSLPGRTAVGIRAARGIAAVDPSVIPLGTRMTIPGYGKAVAADTGASVRGASIDLWFPSKAEARAWGRRTVRIRLH